MLCRRSNVSWRTRIAFQPGNILRAFSDASDVGESVLLMSHHPLRDLYAPLPFDLDATIRGASLGGVVTRHVATGALEAQANRGLFGQLRRTQVVPNRECTVAGQHFVEASATELIGATAYLDCT